MSVELMRLDNVVSSAHGYPTLDRFCLSLYQGEMLGVFSRHLRVKNDLVDLIVGRKGANSGRVYFEGQPCPFNEVNAQRLRKAGLVSSVSTLIQDLSVAENIFVMRRGVQAQIIDRPLIRAQTRHIMDEFGLHIDPDVLARKLLPVDSCQLQIVKAVVLGARVVVLQDLSGFLSDFEMETIIDFLGRLTSKGIGLLMVDSSDSLLRRYADRTLVVKNGKNFWEFKRHELTQANLAACFSGAERYLPHETAGTSRFGHSAPMLVFDQVQLGSLGSVSFKLHRGEQLSIVDQTGRGIEDIKALLSGECQPAWGEIRLDDAAYRCNNVWGALDNKVAFVVENPAEAMTFPDLTALENLCFPASNKIKNFWLNPKNVASCLQEYQHFFEPDALRRYPNELSRQDMHKLVYCRWHLFNPKVLVCMKPFNSVEKWLEDISSYFIEQMLSRGVAVLILSSIAPGTQDASQDVLLTELLTENLGGMSHPR